jgi:hypothetical protein
MAGTLLSGRGGRVDDMQTDKAALGYRVFLRNQTGNIERVLDFQCDGDEAGKQMARTTTGSPVVELWQGARLVARYDGNGTELPLHA